MSKPNSPLQKAEVRVRRGMFVAGLGLVSLVGGILLSVLLTLRLGDRLAYLPLPVAVVLSAAIQNAWLLAALPAVTYAASRFLELNPWRTAVGAALTGEFFVLSVIVVQNGFEVPLRSVVGYAVSFALGVVLTAQAVKRGRHAAEEAQRGAEQRALARKSEYDEFAREAQRLADRPAAPPAVAPAESPPPPVAAAPVPEAPEPEPQADSPGPDVKP